MIVKVIASGSSGNATYIKNNDTEILIDCGITFKKIKDAIINLGSSIENVTHCFITHEHIDHIRGLQVLLKRSNIKICLTNKTYKYLCSHSSYQEILNHKERIIILESNKEGYNSLNINDLTIKPFKTFHDAVESVCYVIDSSDKKLVYITDTGYIPESYYKFISNAHIYILECNHDPDMLMDSNRPFMLKQRILGDKGHLSNKDALYALSQVLGDNTKYVIYAHISEECNHLKLINEAKCQIFNKLGIDVHDCNFDYALRDGAKVIEI